MGRSSSSCLKIIACGCDASEDDDIDVQAKASSDKHGWSFKKRSGRQRVLGNSVSAETATVTDKEIPQGTNTRFQSPDNSYNPDEKSQLPRPAEKIAESVFVKEHISAVVVTSANVGSATYAESKTSQAEVAVKNGSNATSAEAKITIPAVISGEDSNKGLAEPRIDNSVAVSEVDTNTTSAELKISESVVALENDGSANAIINDPAAIIIQTAIRGFLAQRVLFQLKSAIKLQAAIRGYLVRRNAVESLHCIRAIVKVQALVRSRSSKSLEHKNKPTDAQFSAVKLLKNGFARQLLESTPKSKYVNIRCDPLRPNSAWGWLERWMSVSTSEVDLKLEPIMEPKGDNQVQETAVSANAESEPMVLSNSVSSKFTTTDVAKSQESEENHITNDVSTVDSRKADNSAYIAVESKSEELCAAEISGTSISSSHEDVNIAMSVEETENKMNEATMIESAPFDPRSHVTGSECGTELSISSNLDSPDRSNFGSSEAEPNSREFPGGESNGMSRHYVTDLPSVSIQQEEAHRINGISVDPVVDQKLEMKSSDLQANQMATESSQMEQKQGHKSSPEASPKSHRTIPESQGTPSSQVSIKSKRNKIEKSGSHTKRSSLSTGKKNLPNPGRSSTENLAMDHESGKRRNSFGSSKSNNVDREPGDSSSHNSLPSYMQATESARAKAHSPRSSPDVHDKEVSSRKRHSLPGASGRQVSPRIQRLTSQAAQDAKANGSNERKWQR